MRTPPGKEKAENSPAANTPSHATWFGLSYHEFVLFQYGGMILFALGILVFFLIPLLAIQWVKHSENQDT